MMQELLIANGLPALFLLSFLAATVLPIGSEWLLVALVLQSGQVVELVAVATIGNYLGACTTYLIGFYGGDFLRRRILRLDEQAMERARQFYNRYGCWSLLVSWLPVVGDPLCLVAGALRLNFLLFSLLVAAGKLGRYSLVAYLVTRI